MTATTLKNLAIFVAVLAGGAALAMVGLLTQQQIIARHASAPESATTTQHSTPANQIGQAGASVTVAPPVATAKEAQPTPTPSARPAGNGSAENSPASTASAKTATD